MCFAPSFLRSRAPAVTRIPELSYCRQPLPRSRQMCPKHPRSSPGSKVHPRSPTAHPRWLDDTHRLHTTSLTRELSSSSKAVVRSTLDPETHPSRLLITACASLRMNAVWRRCGLLSTNVVWQRCGLG
eukprot:6940560-Prymnesium_polylepis.1